MNETTSAKWPGFIAASKRYMGYEGMTLAERLRFWMRLPGAWFRFVAVR